MRCPRCKKETTFFSGGIWHGIWDGGLEKSGVCINCDFDITYPMTVKGA